MLKRPGLTVVQDPAKIFVETLLGHMRSVFCEELRSLAVISTCGMFSLLTSP